MTGCMPFKKALFEMIISLFFPDLNYRIKPIEIEVEIACMVYLV